MSKNPNKNNSADTNTEGIKAFVFADSKSPIVRTLRIIVNAISRLMKTSYFLCRLMFDIR